MLQGVMQPANWTITTKRKTPLVLSIPECGKAHTRIASPVSGYNHEKTQGRIPDSDCKGKEHSEMICNCKDNTTSLVKKWIADCSG